MAITGMTGAVYVSDVNEPLNPFTELATECVDPLERKHFRVIDDEYRYWPLDPAEAQIRVWTKEDEEEWEEYEGAYTVIPIGGCVIFEEAIPADVEVGFWGNALTLIQAGGFFNWSIDLDGEDAEATTFQSGGWKDFVRTLKGWSGSAEAYWGDTRFYDSLGKTVVVKLFVDAGEAQDCLEGFAIINGEGIENPVDGLVQETVDFTGTGPLYIRI